ncbi:MAG: hypothetical protein J6Y53_02410 [Alphaproteobacteria bacterium]|nr:hypothetical protein [Alphaproteobacteria bacterium]
MYNQNENQTNYEPDYSKMTIREENVLKTLSDAEIGQEEKTLGATIEFGYNLQ